MKTIKKLITVIAILLSVQVFATSDIQIRTNGNTEVVIEADQTSGEGRIRIFDEENTLLFYEIISEDKYLKTFRVSTLPNGKYFVEYENENKINTAIIVKSAENTLYTSNFDQIRFKPMIEQKGDYINVGMTNPQLQKVSISVTDFTGYQLVNIKNLKGLFIKKTFNTHKLPKGDYSLKVKCGDKSYSKLVSIK